jgi:hypothetical protein
MRLAIFEHFADRNPDVDLGIAADHRDSKTECGYPPALIARTNIRTRSFRTISLDRSAKHQQSEQPDDQEDEKENLGDSHGSAGDSGEAQ